MDDMPDGWDEVIDLDIMNMTDNIKDLIKIELRVIENNKVPKDRIGRFIVQRKYPDRYSTMFVFEDKKLVLSWLCGAYSFLSLMRLEPAKIIFI